MNSLSPFLAVLHLPALSNSRTLAYTFPNSGVLPLSGNKQYQRECWSCGFVDVGLKSVGLTSDIPF